MRLAIEFTSNKLEHSALVEKCQFCSIILEGILLMQDETWSFATDISTVNGYAFSGDTLFLEIYFLKEKPRLVIEFFSDINCTNRFIYVMLPYAHQQLRPGSDAMESILAKADPQWLPPIQRSNRVGESKNGGV
jgi:hypothetical protein